MNIKSLQNKGTLLDDDGDEYKDLSSYSFKDSNVSLQAIYVVTKETEMRMDLIALKYLGSTKYIDILCKINNIFNPFSIKYGDVLVIPKIDNDESIYDNVYKTDEKDLRKQFTDTKRLSQKDIERVKRLREKSKDYDGAITDPLPPNMLQPNKKGKTFKDGKIIFGTNLNYRNI